MYILSFLSLAALSSATSLTTRHVLHRVPSGWEAIGSAPGNHLIDMRIGLKQARLDELLVTLAQVSDPAHERYGMYLSKEEVNDLVAPHQESVESVERWLSTHGIAITGRSPGGDWIHALVPVERAENMLNTRYNVYRHTSGRHLVRSESYALPRSLDDHIELIQPTTFFGKLHEGTRPGVEKRASTLFVVDKAAASNQDCDSVITPDCLRQLYGIDKFTPSKGVRNSIGIAGYLEQYANRKDLATFYEHYRPEVTNATYSVETVNGGLDVQLPPGSEANLDVQYASAITYPINMTYYSTGGRPSAYKPDDQTIAPTNEPYSSG
ncbi:tripeptidyl-peptidase I [Ceratobasidium sp. AG-Ba]|nr:tripeptidyl-peptidase I [Ceratobasidium sp. AG-Ba]